MRGRVGRHTRAGGRQCQNWADDQKIVVDLLNRIPVSAGGPDVPLFEVPISGICSDRLYEAISRFEDKNFPTQRSGYVDPGGAMLALMERLATETKLDRLRRNVLNLPSVVSKLDGALRWTFNDLVELDRRLVKTAVNHIDELKSRKDKAGKPLVELPYYGAVFGIAWVGYVLDNFMIVHDGITGVAMRDDLGGHRQVLPTLTNSGTPVVFSWTVATGPLHPALILFFDGFCYPVQSGADTQADTARFLAKYVLHQ